MLVPNLIVSGAPQGFSPPPTPQFIFAPVGAIQNTVRIINNGPYYVYLGGSNVSQYNGFPIPPGSKPVQINNTPESLYVCSGAFPLGPSVVTNAAVVVAGSTSFTVTTTGLTANTTPFNLILGSGTSLEVVQCTAITSNTVISISGTTLYDHNNGSTAATAVARTGQVTVFASMR